MLLSAALLAPMPVYAIEGDASGSETPVVSERDGLANYQAVQDAIDAIPDDLSRFTDDSVAELNAAVEVVDWNLDASQQDTVDDYADAIDSATRGLTWISAYAVGSKTYDGTPQVNIHTDSFGGLFYQDEVYGDAVGTVASPDAGTYTTVDWTDMVFGGADTGWYDLSGVENATGVPAEIVISKAPATISLESPMAVKGGEQFSVVMTISNDIGRLEGLPAADEILFKATGATQVGATMRDGNTYTATFVADRAATSASVSANVGAAAKNYAPAAADGTAELTVTPVAEEPGDEKPDSESGTDEKPTQSEGSQAEDEVGEEPLAQTGDVALLPVLGLAVLGCTGLGAGFALRGRKGERE